MSARDDYSAAARAAFYSVARFKKDGPPVAGGLVACLNRMFDDIDALRSALVIAHKDAERLAAAAARYRDAEDAMSAPRGCGTNPGPSFADRAAEVVDAMADLYSALAAHRATSVAVEPVKDGQQ